jgi:uncharacterized Zn finger protein/superfamily II DNA or RNA helicase
MGKRVTRQKRPFGKTWWGNAWVEAMERIDYNTNRLPRGRRYANNGSVLDINMDDTDVTATVQGSRPRPYRVNIRLREFSATAKTRIRKLIADNVAIATDLSLGTLPHALLPLLAEQKISLLPEDWRDITAHCSCPDWANPCKHLAAVYYIIANEIDKNPFLLFNLRGMATEDLCRASGIVLAESTEGIVLRRDYFVPFDRVEAGYQNSSAVSDDGRDKNDLDLAFPPLNVDALFSLLPDSPLFYSAGDFKSILLAAYEQAGNAVDSLNIVDDNGLNFRHTNIYLICGVHGYSVFVTPPSGSFDGMEGKTTTVKIPVPEGKKLGLKKKRGCLVPFDRAFDLFVRLPFATDSENNTSSTRFFNISTSVALSFIRSGSYLPEVIQKEGGNFTIRYIPLIHSEKIETALKQLKDLMPPVFCIRTVDNSVLEREGLIDILSLMITAFINGLHKKVQPAYDKLLDAFFWGAAYHARVFEEQQTGKSVSDWLARLSIRKHDISPVIRIEFADSDQFNLHIDVENKKDVLSSTVSLSALFDGKEPLFSHPVALLRTDVSRQIALAGQYFAPLKDILNSRGTGSCALDADQMAAFLTATSEIFDMLGIKIVVPRELQRLAKPRPTIKAAFKGKERGKTFLSLEGLLNFTWEVAIGDIKMSEAEFLKLAKSAGRIVKFRDQYVLLDPDAVKGIMDRLARPIKQLTPMETLQAALTGESGGVVFSPDEALKRIIDDIGRIEDVAIPSSLNGNLRPYQERGYRWLYSNMTKGFGSCLADDMGLGKTIQVIALLLALKEREALTTPALVVCPTTLVGNWLKECARFAPTMDCVVYHGAERKMDEIESDLVITTYGTLRRDLSKLSAFEWPVVIIDEAQNIKNPDTDQTRAVKLLKARAFIAMSGTPVENRLSELWSIFDFTNKGYLGHMSGFQQKFALPIEKYRNREQIEKLKAATGPFIMRRLKSDRTIIDDLPEKLVFEEYCYLTKEQSALYRQVVKNTMKVIEESEGIERKGLIFSLITSLKQICNHPAHFSKKGRADKNLSGKTERLIELTEKILNVREKALIFTQYREMGDILTEIIESEHGEEALFFHGGLTRKKRDAMVDSFQEDGIHNIMIISLKAGGTGLNLTSASNVIHYDLWWNPAVEEQATDRTYRIGQKRNVMVHRLITLGTFEEKIDEMIKAKRELADLTVATGERWLTEMSDRELRNLFVLTKA